MKHDIIQLRNRTIGTSVGKAKNAHFTERLPTASILSCTSNASHSLKAPCLLPSGSGHGSPQAPH